jgi:hypoxanthine-guanine phosphoribosyltransferase
MDKIRSFKTLCKKEDFSLYDASLSNSGFDDFKTRIISTPETRDLCTNPFLVGKDYRDALGKAITKTLLHEEFKKIYQNMKDEQLNVLHFLRGGLNFQILESLGKIGKGRTRASFMSSERVKLKDKWYIRDDQYVKLTFSDNDVIFIGDLVASGVTLRCALEKIFSENKSQVRHIVMFTIGSEEAEKILLGYHKLFKKSSKNFTGTSIVFIEGIFHTPNPETKARIKLEGTDLIPLNVTLAPEFEQELNNEPLKALERCVVYDGGSRGFFPTHHYRDLLEYAEQVEAELKKGATLYDLILDRWENAEKLPSNIKLKLKNPEEGIKWVKQRKQMASDLIV